MKTKTQIQAKRKRILGLRSKYPERYDSAWERELRAAQRAIEWVLKSTTESKGGE